jgi:MoxR-like ATPase
LQFGASPRASIALDRCARAKAWLAQREFVAPEDIQDLAYDVLRHRLILSYEAEAEGITADYVISELLARVAVP